MCPIPHYRTQCHRVASWSQLDAFFHSASWEAHRKHRCSIDWRPFELQHWRISGQFIGIYSHAKTSLQLLHLLPLPQAHPSSASYIDICTAPLYMILSPGAVTFGQRGLCHLMSSQFLSFSLWIISRHLPARARIAGRCISELLFHYFTYDEVRSLQEQKNWCVCFDKLGFENVSGGQWQVKKKMYSSLIFTRNLMRKH